MKTNRLSGACEVVPTQAQTTMYINRAQSRHHHRLAALRSRLRAPSLLLLAALTTVGVPGPGHAASPPRTYYSITDLGTLGGDTSRARGINNLGQVAGSAITTNGQTHAFRTDPNRPINPATDDLGTLGGTNSFAQSINDKGEVVGNALTAAGAQHGFRTAPNSPINPLTDELPTFGGPSGYAFAINNHGVVVGWAYTADHWGDVYDFAGFRTGPNLPFNPATDNLSTSYSCQAFNINDRGQAVGEFNRYPGIMHAFRTALGKPIVPATDDLNTVWTGSSLAWGINNLGQVVGRAYFNPDNDSGRGPGVAFRTAADSAINPATDLLGTLGGTSSTATFINTAGQVVGFADTASQARHAFLWEDATGMLDLNDLIPSCSGWVLTQAAGINDAGQIVGWGTNRDGKERAFLLTPAPFKLIGLEVTQAIQDWRNTVPLVAGKKTWVRAHIQAGTAAKGLVTARLRGTNLAGRALGPPLDPVAPGLILPKPNAADAAVRAEWSETLNFQLPPEWCSGTNVLSLETTDGLPFQICSEPAEPEGTGCDGQIKVSFRPAPYLRLTLIPIDFYNPVTRSDHLVSLADTLEIENRIKAIFPLAKSWGWYNGVTVRENVRWTGLVPVKIPEPPTGPEIDLDKFIALIGEKLDKLYTDSGSPSDLYCGVWKGPPWGGGNPDIGGSVTKASLSPKPWVYTRYTHAHELGHLLDRPHASDLNRRYCPSTDPGCVPDPTVQYGPCDEPVEVVGGIWPDGILPEFPFYFNNNAMIGPVDKGDDQMIFGLDTSTSPPTIVNPYEHFELMSYGGARAGISQWISSFTYTNLWAAMDARFSPPPPPPPLGPSQPYLLVRGFIDQTMATATLLPFGSLTATAPPPSLPAGNYFLRLLDGAGGLVQQVAFKPRAGADAGPGQARFASFLIPVPADPTIKQAVILHHTTVLASLTASAHPPQISLPSPGNGTTLPGGSVTLEWTASDPDGDALTYTVLFSRDAGATWQALATDLTGPQYEVNTDYLNATAEGRIKVIASDGFLTAAAESPGQFTVAGHAPRVILSQPAENQSFSGNQLVSLVADARDMEDGYLSGTNLTWSSSLQGTLGQGEALYLSATTLAKGAHLVTVVATDSSGLTATASVHIVVWGIDPAAVPRLDAQAPPDVVLAPGTDYTWDLAIAGLPPFVIQWFKDGNPIPSGSIHSATAADAGGYFVVVTNANGACTSRVAQVTLSTGLPAIVSGPNPESVSAQPGNFVVFNVQATGPETLAYRWRKVGNYADVAAGTNLLFGSVDPTDTGFYHVIVTNHNGAVTSRVCVLAVAPATALGLALNAPQLTVTNHAGNPAWTVDGNATSAHDGLCAARTPAMDPGAAAFSATVTGPTNVTFWWRISANPQSFLDLAVDGAVSSTISGETDWAPQALELPAGEHTLTWTFRKLDPAVAGQDAAWVDQLVLSPSSPGGIEITDFTTGGNAPWFLQTTTTHDSADAWQSGALTAPYHSTWVETTVTGHVAVAFWWKVSTHPHASPFYLLVNGNYQAAIGGEQDWTPYAISLNPGTNTLRWTYESPSSYPTNCNANTAWLDQVMVTNIAGLKPTVISQPPASLTAPENYPVYTRIGAAVVGEPPLYCQWQRDGANVPPGYPYDGAQTQSLRIWQAQTNHAGAYRLVVTNAFGSVTSSVVQLLMAPAAPLVFEFDPQDRELCPGANVSFGAGFYGSGPLAYQWETNGVPAPNQTNAYCSIRNASAADTAGYRLIATNLYGSATSRVAQIVVTNALPRFTTGMNPESQTVDVGNYASIWANVAGPMSVENQVLKDGQLSEEFLSNSLWFPVNDPTNAGLYQFVLSNCGGSVTSRVSALAVPPVDLLGLALDARQFGFTNVNYNEWFITTDPALTHDGLAAAQSPPLAGPGETAFETVIQGPGRAQFWWKISAAASARLELRVNGGVVGQISGERDWVQQSVTLAAGPQTLRWRFVMADGTVAGANAAWVDQLTLPAPGSVIRYEVTNFTAGGPAGWFRQSAKTHDGVSAWQSGGIADSQETWLRSTVTGPGTLSFWWAVDSQFNSDYLDFSVDGSSLTNLSGSQPWSQLSFDLPPGPHELQWRYGKDDQLASGADAGWVDQVRFLPAPTRVAITNLATAGGASGGIGWYLQTTNMHTTPNAWQSGRVESGYMSYLFTTVEGPGTVSFWWSVSPVSSVNGHNRLDFQVDGSSQTNISDNVAWQEQSWPLGSGSHVLEWTYWRYDATVAAGLDAGWVDDLFFTPTVLPLTLAQALNATNLTFTTGGDASWWAQATDSHDGVAAAQSGPLGDQQESWLQTTVTGPGTLAFWWVVESEAGGDALELLVDGHSQLSRAGLGDWQQETLVLPEGSHTVRWRYAKNGSVAVPRDAGWLDEVTWTPVTFAEALDAPAYEFQMWPSSWFVQTTNTHDGVDAVQAMVPPARTQNWLYTEITGPGTLTFWGKISGAPGDSLQFMLDSSIRGVLFGNWDWRQFTYEISPGPHTVGWCFWKDNPELAGLNAVFLDQVAFTPRTAPTLAVSPQPAKILKGRPFELVAHAVGDPPLQYQWLKNGANLPGSTSTNYARANGAYEDTGNYAVVVANANGAVTSAVARVVVAPCFYSARNLGTLKNDASGSGWPSEAYDINNAGEVVGTSITDEIAFGNWVSHGFVWRHGQMTDLGDGRNALNVADTNRLPGSSAAYSINDNFEIVGTYEYRVSPSLIGHGHAAYWRELGCIRSSPDDRCALELVDVHPRDLNLRAPDTYGVAINSRRQILLQAAREWTPADYGYLLTPDDPSSRFTSFSARELGSDGDWIMPLAINKSGLAVGWYRTFVGGEQPFLYDGTNKIGIGVLTNQYYGELRSVNDRSVIVGNYRTTLDGFNLKRPFLIHRDGSFERLTNSAGGLWEFEARDINNRNQMVGISWSSGALYTDGRFFDLNDLVLDSLVDVDVANAINDRGQIVGVASFPYQGRRACLLTPTTPAGANQNPIARFDEIHLPAPLPVLIPTSWLLRNDSDPDGDILSVVALGDTATATTTTTRLGGTATLQADAVLYAPPSSPSNNVDRFSYAISDSAGGTATSTLDLTLGLHPQSPAPKPSINPPQLLPDGTVLLSGNAPAHSVVLIFYVGDLLDSYWCFHSIVNVPESGQWSIILPATDGGKPRFYKAEF